MLKSLLSQLAGRGRGPRVSSAVATAGIPMAPAGTQSTASVSRATTPVATGAAFEVPIAIDAPAALSHRWARADAVTLLLPTVAHRIEFLRSTLDFFDVAMQGVRIVISDHTEDGDREVVSRLVADYPNLATRVERHPGSMHFLERLCACARVATTPYVVVHADDDFMLPAAVDEAVTFLDRSPDHVACQGRTFFLKLRAPQSCAVKVNRSMTRAETDVVSRVVAQCTNFTPTLYTVTRREAFIAANEAALNFTTNVVFWQYLSACLLAARGKLRVLDCLHYLRLDNPDGWRASLIRQGDRTHWPHLIVAPEFSNELAGFKAGLSAALASAGAQNVGLLVDDCCLALIRRAFNNVWQHENAELDLLARASQPGSPEHELARYCASLSLAALTRIHSPLASR